MRCLLLWLLLVVTAPAFAKYDECVAAATEKFPVPPKIIHAILLVEGGAPGMERPAAKSSFDLGPMQINDRNLKDIAHFGVTRELLRDHACVNILIGTWQVYQHVKDGVVTWERVARYHSKTPEFNRVYIAKLKKAIRNLGG